MTPERHALIKEVFVAAVAVAPDERSAVLDQRCGDDLELRQEVERLIEIRRKLVATESRVEAIRATTLSERETMALVSGLIAALQMHIDDPAVIEAIGREVELLVGG